MGKVNEERELTRQYNHQLGHAESLEDCTHGLPRLSWTVSYMAQFVLGAVYFTAYCAHLRSGYMLWFQRPLIVCILLVAEAMLVFHGR
jgi:hypothetical protein